MGEEADDIMVAFGLSTEEAKQYHIVKGKFEAHFVVKRNVVFERAKFNQRSQQDGESVDNFITDLYCLAEYCEFGTLRDDLIRDRIVVGIKDKKLSEQLQLDSKLTLEKAITKARQSETVTKQQPFLQEAKSEPPVPASVDHLSKGKGKDSKEDMKKKKKPPKPPKFKNGKTPEAQCSRCLSQSHPKRQCPARESKCMKCSKIGHWAKACKSLPDKRVAEVNFTGRQDEGELFLGELTELSAVQGGAGDSWKALVSMNGQLMEFKVDSGADVTVIPPSLFHSLKPTPSLSKTTRVLMGPCKQKLSCLGTFTAKLRVQDKVTQEQVWPRSQAISYDADSFIDEIRQEAEQSLAAETKALDAFCTLSTLPINLEAIRLIPSKVVAMLLSASHEQHVLNFITSSVPALAWTGCFAFCKAHSVSLDEAVILYEACSIDGKDSKELIKGLPVSVEFPVLLSPPTGTCLTCDRVL
ncbi:hypothetical protein ACROYT_G007030 [Oculina patagonica]